MDSGWETGVGQTDGWSGAAAGSDLSFAYTSAATGGDTATPSSSGGYAGASGSSGYSRGLNVKAQLSIERLPFETSIETIRNIFGRYGRIARVVCDYKIAEERLNVWLDYEDEKFCENALREHGRKMERNTIVVSKNSTGEGGFGGNRGPKKDAWGNISRGPKGDRGDSGASSGLATSSDTTAASGDWGGADWGASTSGTDNNSGFDSSFDSEDRRSSRGRGGGRGGRDRGGRGGGRGRGGGGGGRYQPYDKSDDFGEKSALPAWDDIVAGKSSTSSATPKADWGSSGDADSGNKDSVPFSQQPTQQLHIDWD